MRIIIRIPQINSTSVGIRIHIRIRIRFGRCLRINIDIRIGIRTCILTGFRLRVRIHTSFTTPTNIGINGDPKNHKALILLKNMYVCTFISKYKDVANEAALVDCISNYGLTLMTCSINIPIQYS